MMHRASRAKSRLFISASSLVFAVTAGVAYAQPASDRAAEPAALDEVVVTGSRIVREGYEAPTPLTVVDSTAIESGSTSNVADYINTMPVFSGSFAPGNAQFNISNGTSGVNNLNLRNLGAVRTLVLLDGQRSVGSLLTGTVDVNVFPQQLIQRVDVVTAGASAVYGSDAVSGVVNFIIDKEFTGVKGEISGGITSYGDDENYKVGLSAGFDFGGGRGHVLLSGEQVDKTGVLDSPRAWNYIGVGWVTNPNYTATNGQPRIVYFPSLVGNSNGTPGGMIVSGPLKGTYFGPGGVPGQLRYGDLVFDPSMHGGDFDYTDIHERGNSLSPAESRQNVFTRVDYDITDDINVFTQLAWANSQTNLLSTPQFNPGNAGTLKADNAFIPAEIRTRMQTLNVTTLQIGTYNFDLPTTGIDNQRMVNRYVVGANGKFDALGSAWAWNGYFQYGYSRASIRATNMTRRDRYTLSLDAVRDTNNRIVCRSTRDVNPNNGCVPYNVLGEGVNSENVVRYLVGDAFNYQRITESVWAGSVQGEPFSNWAGPVSVSASFEHRRESVKGMSDPDSLISNWFVGNYLPLNGAYNVTEGALETVIPIANGKEWADTWDFNAAARATSYSNSGYVTTYKAGTTYAPIADVKFRVTRSRDIRAPNLQELFAAGTGSFPTLPLDPFTNTSPQYRGFAVGNPNLKPEKADTTGIGVVLAPRFLPGFTASVDYWNIRIKDAIAPIGAQSVVDLCFQGNQAFCQFVRRFAPTGVAPYTTIGMIDQIQTGNVNLAVQIARGMDFEGTYRWAAEDMVSSWAGDFSLHANATMYFKNYRDDGLLPPTDSAGENAGNGPPNWRLTGTFSYNLNPFSATLTARAMSAGTYNNDYIVCTTGCPTSTAARTTVTHNSIPGYLYFDASVVYKFAVGEADAEAFLNVRNLGNVDPVPVGKLSLQFATPAINSVLYDSLGRVFRAGFRFRM